METGSRRRPYKTLGSLAANLFSAATLIHTRPKLLRLDFGSAVRDQLGGPIPTRRQVSDTPPGELDRSESLRALLRGNLAGHQLKVVPGSARPRLRFRCERRGICRASPPPQTRCPASGAR